MPLYNFKCCLCLTVSELLLPMSKSDVDFALCPSCGLGIAERQVELCAMRPDSLWAGHYIENYGYTTSSSKLAQIRKDRHLVEVGDRADREAMKKTADEAAKARDEKFSKDTRKFIEDRFAGAGVLDSFGQIRPEATRKLSDEELLDPEAQKRKKETITIAND